jgi:hypothetical protein
MTINPVQIVDGAITSGRIHPRARDRWLCDLAAGGRRGGKALATLLAMAPGIPGPGSVAASGNPRPRPLSDSQIYGLLFPTADQAARESERIITETGKAAKEFAESAQPWDNQMTTAKGIEAQRAAAAARTRTAAPAADPYDALFGKEPDHQ